MMKWRLSFLLMCVNVLAVQAMDKRACALRPKTSENSSFISLVRVIAQEKSERSIDYYDRGMSSDGRYRLSPLEFGVTKRGDVDGVHKYEVRRNRQYLEKNIKGPDSRFPIYKIFYKDVFRVYGNLMRVPRYAYWLRSACEFLNLHERPLLVEAERIEPVRSVSTECFAVSMPGFISVHPRCRLAPVGFLRFLLLHECAHLKGRDSVVPELMGDKEVLSDVRVYDQFCERRADCIALCGLQCRDCLQECCDFCRERAVVGGFGYLSSDDMQKKLTDPRVIMHQCGYHAYKSSKRSLSVADEDVHDNG